MRKLGLIGVLAALALSAPAAHAATEAGKSLRLDLLRAAASSEALDALGLQVNGRGGVTTTWTGFRTRANVVAVRSAVAPSWAALVLTVQGRADVRHTVFLQRRAGRWQVRLHGSRGEEAKALCRSSEPGIAVAVDLGLGGFALPGRCAKRRDPARLTRAMSASEVASVRGMVEWRYDEDFELQPGPVQPAVHEVFASNCEWDGRGRVVAAPYGRVSRSDPRFGLLVVSCVTGSDGFALLENPTAILVRRAGRSGPFTAALAHTFMNWSIQGQLCDRDRRWPIPAAPRVDLQFCTPFPAALRSVLKG